MAKADKDGVYQINGSQFKVRKGDTIPDGAEFTATKEERKQGPAPENRAEGSAPENRSKPSKKDSDE